MKKTESTPPSTSFVLTRVPASMTESDLRDALSEFGQLENVVFHYMAPGFFTNTVTIVFPTIEAADKFASKSLGKKLTKKKLRCARSIRPDSHSLSRTPGAVKLKVQQDDVPYTFNPWSKNIFQRDWSELSEVPDIPEVTVKVSLRYNLLTSFELALQNVESINLTGNNLKHMISMKNFPKLSLLVISHNLLEKLPEFSETVTTVDASYNNLIEIDSSVSLAKSLTMLDVSHNQISSIPVLPKELKRFHAHFNQIERFEGEDQHLPMLEDVTLWRNKITKIPRCFSERVGETTLAFNQLTQIDLSALVTKIQKLNLCHCELDSVPPELFELKSLQELVLWGNHIREIPVEFSKSCLTAFNISENPISVLPTVPLQLETLRINFCEFTDLSAFVPAFNSIKRLGVVGNKLTRLPPLPSVVEVFAASNNLTEIPEFQVDIFSPYVFDFSYNSITKIPPLLGLMRMFDVSHNNITDIPDELLKCRSRLTFVGNPIKRAIQSDDIGRVEALDVVETGIEIAEKVESEWLQELFLKYTDHESDDIRLLLLDVDDSVGYSEMLGLRPGMEDAIIVRRHFRDDTSLYAVFDGHSGRATARYAAIAFPALLKDRPISSDSVLSVINEFQEQLISINETSGSTMDLAFVTPTKLLLAHLGDGRIALYNSQGDVRVRTYEQIPKNRTELERLRSEKIALSRMRTSGIIAMSRSLGDPDVAGMSRVPVLLEIDIEPDDRWLVIGCDGLWDDVGDHAVKNVLTRARNPKEAAILLRDQAYWRGSEDNISVIVVDLRHPSL